MIPVIKDNIISPAEGGGYDIILVKKEVGGYMNWTQLMCKERIRKYSKKTSSKDLRTEFERDYHRIISSAAFRRLQDKTQVFPLDKSDFIRTRLTHSLEVSSFAKSLGQSVGSVILKEQLDDDFTEQTKSDICDVLQVQE